MYLHLGNNFIIPAERIIAILNIKPPISDDLIDIIDTARLERKLAYISEKGKEKTMVVCREKIYLSPISSTTLYKRAFRRHKEG